MNQEVHYLIQKSPYRVLDESVPCCPILFISRRIVVFSSHISLDLLRIRCPSGFPTKTHTFHVPHPSHRSRYYVITLKLKRKSSSFLRNLVCFPANKRMKCR